eukprot:jgi/Mesvir1/13144/Mv06113-RA.1
MIGSSEWQLVGGKKHSAKKGSSGPSISQESGQEAVLSPAVGWGVSEPAPTSDEVKKSSKRRGSGLKQRSEDEVKEWVMDALHKESAEIQQTAFYARLIEVAAPVLDRLLRQSHHHDSTPSHVCSLLVNTRVLSEPAVPSPADAGSGEPHPNGRAWERRGQDSDAPEVHTVGPSTARLPSLQPGPSTANVSIDQVTQPLDTGRGSFGGHGATARGASDMIGTHQEPRQGPLPSCSRLGHCLPSCATLDHSHTCAPSAESQADPLPQGDLALANPGCPPGRDVQVHSGLPLGTPTPSCPPLPRPYPALVIYGVGNFQASPVSRSQMALALRLAADLGAPSGSLEFYDPALTSLESDVLRRLGVVPLGENEECRRRADRVTLFYMPHCEARLYDNLLSANWSHDQLCRLVILGNSFRRYQERWDVKPSPPPPRPDRLLQVEPFVVEVPVSCQGFGGVGAFNELSFHHFDGASVPLDTDTVFWGRCEIDS